MKEVIDTLGTIFVLVLVGAAVLGWAYFRMGI